MRFKLDVVAWSAAAALVVSAAIVGATANAADSATKASVQSDVTVARQATAKYQDLAVAEAAGFTLHGECVSDPAGTGTMGYHYIHPAKEADPAVAVNDPEGLLYIPNDQGEMQLVAVEYIRIDADQDLATDDDRPTLFGRGFDGPMLGHGPGRPIHYDLHAWIWRNNPSGMFTQYNPAIHCPEE